MTHETQILLNGDPIEVGHADTVAELINGMALLLPDGHVLASIEIDGVAWEPDQDAQLATVTVESTSHINVTTQRPETAAQNGIEEIGMLANAAASLLVESAGSFRLGQLEPAGLAFVQAIDLVGDLTKFLPLYFDFVALRPANSTRVKYGVVTEAIEAAGTSVVDAQGRGDWNLVADVTQYDLAPAVTELGQIGDALRQQAAGPPRPISGGDDAPRAAY